MTVRIIMDSLRSGGSKMKVVNPFPQQYDYIYA